MSRKQLGEPKDGLHSQRDVHELTDLVEKILSEAKKHGADQAEVAVTDEIGVGITARNREVENIEFERGRAFGITVYVGQSSGNTSTADTSRESIVEAVSKAINIARFTQSDPCKGLPDPNELAKEFHELDHYHPQPMEVDSIREQALAADAATMEFDSRMIPSEGSSASAVSSCFAYGNSLDFLRAEMTTRYGISAQAIAKDESGMQTDYWYRTKRKSSDLPSAVEIGDIAAQRTLDRLSPRPVPTGKYPVLFDAHMAASLIGIFISAISGSALYRQESFLCDSLATKVATENLTLTEYPHLKRALGSRNFDSDGVGTKQKTFLNAGIVTNYILGTYSARRLGMSTTGNAGGVFNLTVEAPQTEFQDLLKEMDEGLVVTSLMGQGVNRVTGDYSRGAAGYWVENGERAFAVDNITIAANMKDILNNLIGFGNDVETDSSIRTGSILVESMTVAAS